jgi:hypothetical protein
VNGAADELPAGTVAIGYCADGGAATIEFPAPSAWGGLASAPSGDTLAVPGESLFTASAGVPGGTRAPPASEPLAESATGRVSSGGELKSPSVGTPDVGTFSETPSSELFAAPDAPLVTAGAGNPSGATGAPPTDAASARSSGAGLSVAIDVLSKGAESDEPVAIGLGSEKCKGGALSGVAKIVACEFKAPSGARVA